MRLSDLKSIHVSELVKMAVANDIEGANRMRKQDLVFALLKNQARKGEVYSERAHWKFCKMVSGFYVPPIPPILPVRMISIFLPARSGDSTCILVIQ